MEETMIADVLKPLQLTQGSGPVSQHVVRVLRDKIITNQLQPGQSLAENELAGHLGISRQPIREALIRLAEANLVRILPQRGTTVTRISLARVAGGQFVRDAVERAVVRRTALEADAVAVEIMLGLIDEQEQAIRDLDYRAFLKADDEMHLSFAEAIGQKSAWTTLADVKLQMDRVRYLSLPTDATPGRVLIAEHRAIVAAIARRDPGAAEEAMQQHLAEVHAALPRLVQRMPDYFEQ
jgi:GntR family transcriptional regulator, rspAB operon transcriptional repressor